jgi:hypothetical protein
MNSRIYRIAALIIGIAAVGLSAAPTLWSQTSSSGQQPERFQRSFAITSAGTLAVDNYKGTIHVIGSDTNQVVVDVHKRFEGSDSDRKWWLENTQINFHNDSGRVSVDVKYPTQVCIFCWEIRVPRQINVTVESYKPDIKVSFIKGDIRIKSYKSPITIESTTGAVRVDTYKDSIKLNNVTIQGTLDVRSYKAETEISARSLGESASLESDKGSIVLRVPSDTGMDVDFSGGRHSRFHSDLPLTARTGSSFGGDVRGTINQGGTRLRLRTERGSVAIERMSAY